MHDGPGGSGPPRKAILEQVDASLRALFAWNVWSPMTSLLDVDVHHVDVHAPTAAEALHAQQDLMATVAPRHRATEVHCGHRGADTFAGSDESDHVLPLFADNETTLLL